MRTITRIHSISFVSLFALAVALAPAAECGTAGNSEAKSDNVVPRMNVVFLDDGAVRVDAASQVKRNDWQEWRNRIPTFLGLLHKFVADFHEASGDQVSKEDSLFALEVSAELPSDQKDKVIVAELQRIFQATGRPSSILARSTSGEDQLRLAFQDDKDYRPAHAARFLRAFAEMSPIITHSGIAAHFGPFQPPPTIVFDPRPTDIGTTLAPSERAKQRWGLVEEDTYLLPHYLLHALTILNEATVSKSKTFYMTSAPEPGILQASDVHITVTDLGIAQWKPNLRTGDNFAHADNRVFRDIPSNGQILVVQPSDREFRQKSDQQWIREITPVIEQKIRLGLASGTKDFEIQNIENMNWHNYVSPAGQKLADRWGGIAHSAIDRAVKNIQVEGHSTRVDGVFASNGTKVLARNSDAISYLNGRITFVDGRASKQDTLRLIDQVGQHNFRSINTGGDALAPHGLPWVKDSMGNFDSAKDIKEARPGVQTLWLDRGLLPVFFTGHVKSAVNPYADFKVKEWTGNGTVPLGRMTGKDLMTSIVDRAKQSDFQKPGGILFDKKNLYMLDLTGKVAAWSQQSEDAYRSKQTFQVEGRPETMLASGRSIYGKSGKPRTPRPKTDEKISGARLEGDLVLLHLDLKNPRNGSLPFAVPRFLKPQSDTSPSFGGPWTFEPVTAVGLDRLAAEMAQASERQPQVSVLPAETQTPLVYTADRLDAADETSDQSAKPEPVEFVKNGSRFQPNLIDNTDGTYSWVLRHGVVIQLDAAGLIRSIREPDGHIVSYLRAQNKNLVGKRTADGKDIEIAYNGSQPVKAIGGEQTVQYNYSQGLLQSVTQGSQVTSFVYDNQQLTHWTCGSNTMALSHDSRGRLKLITVGSRTVAIDYVKERNAIQLVDNARTVDWRFGPRGDVIGVVEGSQALLWTKSVEHRIIQVAFGRLEDEPGSPFKKFTITDTIGTDPVQALQ